MSVYKIPLKFKAGEFKFDELNIDEEKNSLNLEYNEEYQLLTYNVPMYENEARIYTLPREKMPGDLSLAYDKDGVLEKVTLVGNHERLIYIRFSNIGKSERGVLKFVKEQADKVSKEIIGKKQTLSRLFIEKFYDGEAVDIAAKTATAEEMRTVIDEYEGKTYTADNSGNYPEENRIETDCETLGVMLMCTDGYFQNMLFEKAVKTFEERVQGNVLQKIKVTDDFKFISEEYD